MLVLTMHLQRNHGQNSKKMLPYFCNDFLFLFLAALLTLLFMADLFANTCCNIELIFGSSLDFTTQELNLAHPASKKGRAVPMDKHWFDSLGPSGQWLVCDFFFFLFCYHANSAQSWKDLCSAGLYVTAPATRGKAHRVTRCHPRGPSMWRGREQFIPSIQMNVPGPSVCRPLVFGNSIADSYSLLSSSQEMSAVMWGKLSVTVRTSISMLQCKSSFKKVPHEWDGYGAWLAGKPCLMVTGDDSCHH